MPSNTQQVWLAEQTYDLVRVELAQLLMERATGSHRVYMEPDQRELRIRQLRKLLRTATGGPERPDDGATEPGVMLTGVQ
jgi:hypothetical protein